ncbi:MAG: thiol:disulfide interchange protein DsbA/DsbL [Deltaproteobacteria bacterium]|jgi:thiol:disulfide interchange protein DsbA|nr:thiol:disulfide interchange protein DsbA/DsbL [Deltaproteobacteria bacterium]
MLSFFSRTLRFAILLSLFAYLPLSSLALAQENPNPPKLVLGEDYRETFPPIKLQSDSDVPLEVAYFFWYGCGTCRKIDPAVNLYMKNLPSDVKFIRAPAAFTDNDLWVQHARVFYALEILGVEQKLHERVFMEIQDKGGMDPQGHAMAGLLNLQEFLNFAKNNNISAEDAEAAWNNNRILIILQRTMAFLLNHDVKSVPTCIINGRYVVTVTRKGLGHFFETIDTLLNQERQALAKKATPLPAEDTPPAQETPPAEKAPSE